MNKSNFLNSLRDETIQEYLNSDRNRSSFIAHQIRDSVNRFEGAIDPEKYEAINELELKNANANVNEIKQKLLDFFNNLTTLADDTSYGTTKYSELYNRVGNYTTILVDYNKLVTLYLTTTNNVLTRQKIYSTLMETKQLYSQLGTLTFKILLSYYGIQDPKIRKRTIIRYFVKILLLLSLFGIINNQFNTNHFFVIPENDILKNIELFLPDQLKRIIREFNLKVELYGIQTPSQPPQEARHRHRLQEGI
jgi:hypothetical protein